MICTCELPSPVAKDLLLTAHQASLAVFLLFLFLDLPSLAFFLDARFRKAFAAACIQETLGNLCGLGAALTSMIAQQIQEPLTQEAGYPLLLDVFEPFLGTHQLKCGCVSKIWLNKLALFKTNPSSWDPFGIL